jgi:hypothetical protein
MPQSAVPEGLVKFAHALVEDAHLQSWFYSLEHLPRAHRNAAFAQMAKEMREAADDADLTSAVSILAGPKMYETVLAAVRERVNEAGPHI